MPTHKSKDAERPLATNAYITTRMRIRAWRKAFIGWLPWIKRARHRKLLREKQLRTNRLVDALLEGPTHAADSAVSELIPLNKAAPCAELCLFVSFAAEPSIKVHVVDHVHRLIDAGVQVILIINTELPAHQLQIPEWLQQKLHGCLVRSNSGYDFAAWAHACTLIDRSTITQRLYFVNDSIVGPTDEAKFQSMLTRFRSLPGDMNGLTESIDQQPHLQSFFLAFSPRLFRSAIFDKFINGVMNLPDKQQVIDLYEVQLTRFIREHGFRCEALFPQPSVRSACNDHTIENWAGLIERGFPYIKASVLKQIGHSSELENLVPAKYWNKP